MLDSLFMSFLSLLATSYTKLSLEHETLGGIVSITLNFCVSFKVFFEESLYLKVTFISPVSSVFILLYLTKPVLFLPFSSYNKILPK